MDETTSARTIRVFLLDDHEAFLRGISAVIGAQADLEVVGDARTAQEAHPRTDVNNVPGYNN